MNIIGLKKKLRDLKQLEERIRRDALGKKGDKPSASTDLIWGRFFSTKNPDDPSVKYSMESLLEMNHEERKEVFEEFFYRLFFQKIKESGIEYGDILDPALLSLLGLPPDAGTTEVKGKFRQLAMKYHPDRGGDHEKMIRLLDIYNEILDKGR